MLTCRYQDSIDFIITSLSNSVWLEKEKISPWLRKCLIDGNTWWLTDPFTDEPAYHISTANLYEAASIQPELGRDALLCGFIVIPLDIVHQHHYTSVESRTRDDRWGVRFIRKSWNTVYLLWTHRNSANRKERPSTITANQLY